MNSKPDALQWSRYIETPFKKSSPIKLDTILQERLKVFLKAREARMYIQD